MTDFGPSDIKRALQEVPTLHRMLGIYLRSIEQAFDSVGTIKTVFSLIDKDGKTYIEFNELDFKVALNTRVVLSGSSPFLLFSFDYEEKDESKPLLKIFIASSGIATFDSFDSKDTIDPDDPKISAGAKIFDKLANAAYHGGHISA